ncbi:hypothetical protein F5148DRAFT_136128 [Russula earlei]|uniref:Uncharacterized protein n=1 Tax=Russula earlei TaxID=71964 RepID=A0ACC0TSW8_9AGAM|nr:hypothetical protein F5148DRAFT_136128 [Russula earlei]
MARSPARRGTHDTLPSAPASPVTAAFGAASGPTPPETPWAPPGLSLSLAFLPRLIFFLPWPARTPLPRLAHHARTPRAHLGIFLRAVCLVGVALSRWAFRVALIGAVAAHAVIVWRGFRACPRAGRRERRGPAPVRAEAVRVAYRVYKAPLVGPPATPGHPGPPCPVLGKHLGYRVGRDDRLDAPCGHCPTVSSL